MPVRRREVSTIAMPRVYRCRSIGGVELLLDVVVSVVLDKVASMAPTDTVSTEA